MSTPRRPGKRAVVPARRLLLAAAAAAGLIAAAALAGTTASAADHSTAAPRQAFLEAGRAYQEGRIPEAVRRYEELVRDGHAVMEVYFNLGNAYLKENRIGPAVLNYRKAWRVAPRDAGVDANVRLALEASGAPEADLSALEIAFTGLSEREWAVAATAAWWTTCLLLCLALVGRAVRRPLVAVAALTGAGTAVALLALWTWRGFDRTPELVVLSGTSSALSAPLASATPLFSLPEGSTVRARRYDGGWVNVSFGQVTGWLPRTACAPVVLQPPPD